MTTQALRNALIAIRDGVEIDQERFEELERLGYIVVIIEDGTAEITEMGAAELAKIENP